MRLYATVTSERAKKGQGGEFLILDITDKHKRKILNLHIYEGERGYILRGSDYGMFKIDISDSKGEKQKGDCLICTTLNGITSRCRAHGGK
jgi:hypothetical protein